MTMAMPRFERGPTQGRVMTWSFAIHVGTVALLFVVPREWLVPPRQTPTLMTISLGGNSAVKTTGTNLIGGRTIEQVAPLPKRPEPVKPTPKPPPAQVITKAPMAPPARAGTPKPDAPAVRPPVTGSQVTRGSTAVDTGARGQGSGLTFDPGAGGGATDLKDFCCPEYLRNLLATIDAQWDRSVAGLRGTTIMRFEVLRSGQIVDAKVSKTSGSQQLDRLARRALANARLSPVPAEYTGDRLIINLQFPYGGQ
jgi:TonB family protein